MYDNPVSATGATQQLTPTQTRDLIGTTIPAKYFDGTDYVDFSFTYGGSTTVDLITAQPAPSFAVGDTVIFYTADLSSVSTNPQYITVDLRPQYSFFDTETVYQFCGLSSNRSNPTPATSVYAPPSWRWHDSLTGDRIFESNFTYNSGANYGYFRAQAGNDYYEPSFVEASFSAQSTFSAYSYRCCFYGNSLQSGRYVFFVSCPIISADSSVASGTDIGSGTTGSGSSGDITVNVDMSTTNGWLSDIADILSGLVDAIVGIFIPDDDDLLQWLDDMHALLERHFGSFIDAMFIIDEVFGAVHEDDAGGVAPGMSDVTVSTSTIGLPRDYTVSAYGVTFTFLARDWQMPLVPDGFSAFLSLFKEFQKIIYLIMFINMINNKLHHYLSPQDGT